MPFTREASNSPTEVGRIVVSFEALTAASTTVDAASVGYVLQNAAGQPKGDRTVDLMPHLTAAQKTTMFNFLSTLRTKIKGEVIP